jgi:hypothetical protein
MQAGFKVVTDNTAYIQISAMWVNVDYVLQDAMLVDLSQDTWGVKII